MPAPILYRNDAGQFCRDRFGSESAPACHGMPTGWLRRGTGYLVISVFGPVPTGGYNFRSFIEHGGGVRHGDNHLLR